MGTPAARVGDTTQHGSPLTGTGCPTVLIAGMPAWRVGDQHICSIPNAPPPACDGAPHGPGSVIAAIPDGGSGICMIGGQMAARKGDIVVENHALVPLPPMNPIQMGAPTVEIGMGGGAGGVGDCPTCG
jgi:uncharacterized Zn-binding protein involved in type VI secretion